MAVDYKSALKFVINVGGIYIFYLFYGLTQEKIFKRAYNLEKKKESKFTYTLILINGQALFSMLTGYLVKRFVYKLNSPQIKLTESIQMGCLSLFSMFCSNQALQFVSYPLQALFKSAKILSILLVGMFFGRKHKPSQYMCALLVTLGILFYNFNEKQKKSNQQTSSTGIILLIASLIGDGVLGDVQNKVTKEKNINSFELMFRCNLVVLMVTSVLAIYTNDYYNCWTFCEQYPQAVQDVAMYTLFGTLGQCFIFSSLAMYGSLLLSIITTTRKFFTIVLSIIYYGHPLNLMQQFSLFLVFVGIAIEFYQNLNSKHSKQVDIEKQERAKLL